MTKRLLGVIVALTVGLSTIVLSSLGVTADAQPSVRGGSPVLTLVGSRQGEAWIRLQKPTRVALGPTLNSDQIRITGDGRAVGAVLERVGRGPDAVLFAMNYNACGTKGCEPLAPAEFATGSPATVDENGDETIVLPKGRYRVVLVADGAPVKVRLSLSGLSESVKKRPSDNAGVTFRKVTNITETPAGVGATFSGGRTYEASRGALVGFQELATTAPGAAALLGTCIVYGEAPPADAYAPFCPTGDTTDDRQQLVSLLTAPVASQVVVHGFGAVGVPPKQQTSLGHYLVSAVPVTSTNFTQFEVPLNRRR